MCWTAAGIMRRSGKRSSGGITGSDRTVSHPAENAAAGQEFVFLRIDRVGLHFDRSRARQSKNPLQPVGTIKWRQRKQIVDDPVAASQRRARERTEDAVSEGLLTGFKGEMSTHKRSGRQELAPNHIRREMHMMMAIVSFRLFAIEAQEFVALGGHEIGKGRGEPGIGKSAG